MKRLRLVALTHSFVDVCYNIQVDQNAGLPKHHVLTAAGSLTE